MVLMVEDKWFIQCPKCEDTREATYVNFEFLCEVCGSIYAEDDVNAYNPAIVDRYFQEFKGAKIGGLLPDPEFEGDEEQQRRERW